jgi:hypothetical protein
MLHRFTYRVILTCFCAWPAGVVRYVGYGAALCRVWRGCVSGACGCGAKQHTLGSSLASGRMRVAPADRALSQEDARGIQCKSGPACLFRCLVDRLPQLAACVPCVK